MRKPKGNGTKYLVRLIRGHLLLASSILFSLICGLILYNFTSLKIATQLIIIFDLGVILFLFLFLVLMVRANQQEMLRRAALQDEGKLVVLFLVLIAAVISLVSIFAQLSVAKEAHGIHKFENIALAALTIFISWIFIHLMFSIHYAHDYYLNISKKKPGGLEFPRTEFPNYLDFFYLSCSIGTSGQTADVGFSDHNMRRAGIVHCVFTFFFNVTVLALLINVLAGLLGS
jgi:uncharacterized membrane protein